MTRRANLQLNIETWIWWLFVEDDSGATAVEYSLIVGDGAGAIIVMIYVFGGKVDNLFNNAASGWPSDAPTLFETS